MDAILIIRNGQKAQSEEYVRFTVCRTMGWDYYTFESQPPSFLEEILIFMKQENAQQAYEMDKANKPAPGRGIKR